MSTFFRTLSGLLLIFFFLNMEFIELGTRLGLKDEDLKEIELETIKRETELQRQKNSEIAAASASVSSQAKLPKLPVFEETNDCIDSYLQRFERFAFNAKWEESTWAINLSALLKGKALDVYSRLPAGEALNYRCLKQALLKRFQLTEEGFPSKFRNSKPEQEVIKGSENIGADFLSRHVAE